MAISLIELKEEIKAVFTTVKEAEADMEISIESLSEGLANAIARQIAEGINTATVTHELETANKEKITGKITIETSIEDEQLAN